ncbi:MAG: DUF4905 domain-containing protein [Cyclobacteriaceae bacterium]
MEGKIEELFSFECDGIIWETALDLTTGRLLLQTRNEEEHETTFSVVDLHTDQWIVRNKQFEENWWIGISAMSSCRALLHIYEDDQNPELKSLLLWDIDQDKVLITYENATLVKVMQGGFQIRKEDGLHTMDWEGQAMEDLPEIKLTEQHNTSVHHPFEYQSGDSDFDTVKSFITQAVNVMPEAGAEYLETDEHLFISYYINEMKMLANYLLISDLNGKVLFNKKINASAKGMGRDTFFIFERKLVFISNNNTLSVYAI